MAKACAISESVYQTNWRNYELSQPKGSLPIAPLAIVVHIASVWVPFTSEAKEAVAHYDELLEEMRLAVKECGRNCGSGTFSESAVAEATRTGAASVPAAFESASRAAIRRPTRCGGGARCDS